MGLAKRLAKLSSKLKASTEYPELDAPSPTRKETLVTLLPTGSILYDLEIIAVDDNDNPGKAFHEYEVYAVDSDTLQRLDLVGCLKFQKGPLKEVGPNGISESSLLAIIIHRLEGFQTSPYKSAFNAEAIVYLRKALDALHRRTAQRVARGVEGTHKV